ncbi:MotE family protein [Campylobacter sp.]|uniref:MotE family protein n=1 Tax=Campylobacter sp. TaxID=205 RepID=UPI0026F5401A|nr:5'-nucleosidase [Campylobacter sp.]
MRKILILSAFILAAFGFEAPVDCVSIFEARKAELLKEVEKIDEAKQGLEAFKASSNALFIERNAQLAKKEADINATLAKIEERKQDIENLLKKNEEILSELKTMTADKVSEAYGKMKDQAAADVLSAMDRVSAATIMYALAPKKISTIMSKMQPNIASEITLLLQKGPPFENSESNATLSSESSPEGPAGNLLNF